MAGFCFSVMGLGVSAEHISMTTSQGPLQLLAVASVIMLCASAPTIGDGYTGGAVFALVVSILTLILAVALLAMTRTMASARVELPVLALFALLWTSMACVVTFNGPFLLPGNGYFGSWAGTAACCHATYIVYKSNQSTDVPKEVTGATPPDGGESAVPAVVVSND